MTAAVHSAASQFGASVSRESLKSLEESRFTAPPVRVASAVVGFSDRMPSGPHSGGGGGGIRRTKSGRGRLDDEWGGGRVDGNVREGRNARENGRIRRKKRQRMRTQKKIYINK